MELHNVPRNSYVRVNPDPDSDLDNIKVPPAAPTVVVDEILYFDHIDGMYSLCYKTKGSIEDGNLEPDVNKSCHIAAWTDVYPLTPEDLYGDFDNIRESIGRSGYGKDGKGEYRQAALKDMSDEWVKASIKFVNEDHQHREYYIKELEYRKEHNITVEDDE